MMPSGAGLAGPAADPLECFRPRVFAPSPQVTPAAAPKRLLVAAHFIRSGRVGGAEQMLYNLLQGFGELEVNLTVACSSLAHLDPDALDALYHQPRTRVMTLGSRRSRILAAQRTALDHNFISDAVLFPDSLVPPLVRTRLGRVMTILHDFQYRRIPQFFTRAKRLSLRLAHSVTAERSDDIVTISEFTRADAARWLGPRAESKLVVIPNPISWRRFDSPDMSRRPLDRPYVLAVAARYPHKNLVTLIQAFAVAARRNRELQLVLCGRAPGSPRGIGGVHANLQNLISALGLADRVVQTGYLDSRTLGNWYRHASAFVCPSLFEGFGMPAVEALGLGVPVLTTACGAIPESTLGLAHYVHDPMRVSEWSSLIISVARDPERFRPITEDAARLRAHYAPTRIAEQYLALCSRN